MITKEPPVLTGEDAIRELLDRAREALARDGERDPELTQALLTAGVTLIADDLDKGVRYRPFLSNVEVTPTEVALAITSMMDAADIDLPQLNMWQALGMGQFYDTEGDGL